MSWIKQNRTLVQRTLYEIEQFEMQDTYGGLNFRLIRQLLANAYQEVNKLEGMLIMKKEENAKLQQELDKINEKLNKQAPDEEPQPKKGKGKK